MKNSLWRFIAIPIGLVVMLLIAWGAEFFWDRGQLADAPTGAPSGAPNPPEHQAAGTVRVPDLPEWQRKVKAEQATESFEVGTNPEHPAFTVDEIRSTPNAVISITFRNQSDPRLNYFHNWVLAYPGTQEQVLEAAESVGPQQDYLPPPYLLIARTQLLAPGESETVTFQVPSEPGDYPYFCTFPGHGRKMLGYLKVRTK